MATNFKDISEKVFNLLKGHGFDLKTFDKDGKIVLDPQEGTRFVCDEPNVLVRVDDLEKEISMQTSEDFADHNLRNLLKELAQDSLLSFDFRVFDKQLKPKGEEIDVARRQETDMNEELNKLRRLSGLEESDSKSDMTDIWRGDAISCPDCGGKRCDKCDNKGVIAKDDDVSEAQELVENPVLIGARILGKIFQQGLKRPIVTTIGLDAVDGSLNTTAGAIKWLSSKVGDTFLSNSAIKQAGPIIAKYGIPAAGVAAALYGGKKLKDFLSNKKDDGMSISQNNQTLNASVSEIKYVDTSVGKIPVKDNGDMLDFHEYMDWEESTGEQRPNRASSRWPGYQRDYEQYVKNESVQMEASTKTVNGCTVYSDGRPLNFADWRKETEMETGRPMKRSAEDQKMDYRSYVNRCKSNAKISEASLGKMTGSRKSSYQPLADNVKIIVRHNKDVNEEVRGARSRNIHSILIQRGEEKFKMAENNLSAARAMARHLHNGGETFDEIGESITEMSREFKKLKEFVNYVKKSNLVNETNEEFVTMAMENIGNIKNNLKRLSGVKTYANAVESVLNYNNVEILEDDLNLESKFTETHFDDKVANVMDSLKAMTSRKQSFESKIVKAIESETFANVKNLLKEDDIVDFDTPHGKLGHQVSQLGYTAQDNTLSNYLHSISSKISAGGQLNQFEYGTIKSCLLSAGQHNVQSAPVDVQESYEAFIDQFVE